MAGFKGSDARNETLDAWLGSTDTVLGELTYWIRLFTVAPAANGTGGTEVSGGSYAALLIDNDSSNFPAAAAGSKSNGEEWDFGEATGDWGTIVFAAVCRDEVTLDAGTIVYGGPLVTPREVLDGDEFRIPIGGAIFTEA
jgi:hypothetical protein